LFYKRFDPVDFDYLVGKHVSSRPMQQDTFLFVSLFYGLGKLDCMLGVLVAVMAGCAVHDKGGAVLQATVDHVEETKDETHVMLLIAGSAAAFVLLWNSLGVRAVRIESKPLLVAWALMSPIPLGLTGWILVDLLDRPNDVDAKAQEQLFICLVEAAALFLVARLAVLSVGYQVCQAYFGIEGKNSLATVHGKHDTALLYSKAPLVYGSGPTPVGSCKSEVQHVAPAYADAGRSRQSRWSGPAAQQALLQSGLATPSPGLVNTPGVVANPTPSPAQFGSSAPDGGRYN
jgi:hypothetical protein